MTAPMHTPCDEWAEKLAVLEGHLSASDRAALEAHLAVCPACSLASTDYRMMRRLIQTLPAPDFPDGLPPRLLSIWGQEDSKNSENDNRLKQGELQPEFTATVKHQSQSSQQQVDAEALVDETLHCSVCGRDFLFSASDQAFFLAKGVTERPKRCPSCLLARMNNGRIPSIDDPHHM